MSLSSTDNHSTSNYPERLIYVTFDYACVIRKSSFRFGGCRGRRSLHQQSTIFKYSRRSSQRGWTRSS
ncbi:hypothetical protein ANTRET_LOCUS5115 [Anthophora retusa]